MLAGLTVKTKLAWNFDLRDIFELILNTVSRIGSAVLTFIATNYKH